MKSPQCADVDGFSLHAAVRVEARDRDRLEHLCRYPLAQLLSPSPSGCTLLVTPDFGELALVTADVYDTSFAVPNVPTLVGVVLHQQLLFAELDTNAVPIRSSSTNGLTVTIGAF